MRLTKTAIFLGLGVRLAAVDGLAAEMPNATPGIDMAAAGAPTPLTPVLAATRVEAPFVAPVQSGPAGRRDRTRNAVTVLNPYHPHWVVQVFGR